MKLIGKKAIVLIVMLAPMMFNLAWADEAALTKRIERLERIIKSQGLTSLMGKVDQLQSEVQRLNGENESLRHELKAMEKRQRELYLDLDQRLQTQPVVLAPAPISTMPEPTIEQSLAVDPAQQASTESTTTPEQVTTVDDSITTETVPEAIDNGEVAYQSALQTLRSGQYEQAIVALEAFPEQYPQSSYIASTYYWQGEANYVLRHFDLAIAAFQVVIEQYPDSSKVADAMLKQGFSQYELGQIDLAKTTLLTVMQQYPDTSSARLAKVRLNRIKQETRQP